VKEKLKFKRCSPEGRKKQETDDKVFLKTFVAACSNSVVRSNISQRVGG